MAFARWSDGQYYLVASYTQVVVFSQYEHIVRVEIPRTVPCKMRCANQHRLVGTEVASGFPSGTTRGARSKLDMEM